MGSGAYPGIAGKQLSYAQIKQLWLNNGGDPRYADVMAAIAEAESGGQTNSLNNTPATGDYSVGLWQINYYGGLLQGRTARFGAPASLASDPNAQAQAAIALQTARPDLRDWQGDAAWKIWNSQGSPIPWAQASEMSYGGSSPAGPAYGNPGLYGQPETSAVTGANLGTGFGPGGCHAKDKNGTNCAINGPGSFCITYCELKAIKGGLLVAAGGFLFLMGGLVLVAYGFKRSGATQTINTVQTAVPAPARTPVRQATNVSRETSKPTRTLRALPDEEPDEADDLFEASRGSRQQNRAAYRRAMSGPSDTSDLKRRTA